LGAKSTQKLFQCGIQTVPDILAMTEEDILFVASNQPNPISRGLLQQFCDEVAICKNEDQPSSIDYRKAENPYIA
jgi:hypothetical protein